ncbi:peptidylprolyl isomerase [Mucilaginibacter pallidiroseus]|uniref:Peptidyl-prolyl cis-trans isomerase n=1 Tax=Mucilaginibacter pallidiroseus TaxID=2599295 RepID=A0A563UFC8_9SPHI|nr:FKBP-type peptidyl-prolyl cis-trans isomerase [Mucilaginibacter pallidiroseus]TWR30006.1 peptidylprolyl isomerase [Mucilaginibacter pallidiroseus]
MKKYILILTVILAGFSSCKKDSFDANKQAATDEAAIQAYLAANPNIKATKDANGVYYQVITEGTGSNPTSTSTVRVNYVGTLLNGSQFDAGTGFTSSLSSVVKGWQYGLPHVKAGGRILLIIPSALGYGNTSPGAGIPKNSVLVFTIDLLGFNN